MVKKKSIKQILTSIIHPKSEEKLKEYDFKYLKSKDCFTRIIGDFKQSISISHYGASIDYNEEQACTQLRFNIITKISLPKLNSWCQKNYGTKNEFSLVVGKRRYSYNLSDRDLELIETYEPTKTQQFKSNVSRAIAGNKEAGHISFTDIEESGFDLFIKELEIYSDPRMLYDKMPKYYNHQSCASMLEFLGAFDLAKEEYIKGMNFWKKHINTDANSAADSKQALINYNKKVRLINKRLGTNLKELTNN